MLSDRENLLYDLNSGAGNVWGIESVDMSTTKILAEYILKSWLVMVCQLLQRNSIALSVHFYCIRPDLRRSWSAEGPFKSALDRKAEADIMMLQHIKVCYVGMLYQCAPDAFREKRYATEVCYISTPVVLSESWGRLQVFVTEVCFISTPVVL